MEEKVNMEIEPVAINFAEPYATQLKGLSSAKTPDLEILINNEILMVHKIILAIGNEVLKSMLAKQMNEAKKNRLEINDCDPTAFKSFIAYLYTSEVSSEDITLDLLVVADKFNDLRLKKQCSEKLEGEISMDNLAEIAKKTAQGNFGKLITACRKFVIQNYAKLAGTPQLEAIIENKQLLAEIFKEYNAVAKKHDELLIKTNKRKFLLYIGEKLDNNSWSGKRKDKYKYPLRFEAGDVEWTMTAAKNVDGTVGIMLTAENKNVQADVQLTVLSDDFETPDIMIEKKNKSYGQRFFDVLPLETLKKKKHAYARSEQFTLEICIDVLNAEPKKPIAQQASSMDFSYDSNSNSDSDY